MGQNTQLIKELLPFLIPFIILQYGLAIWAIVHIIKNPNYRFGNRIMWILISLFISIIGPTLYFIIGRGEKVEE